jgi:hypothetical protein
MAGELPLVGVRVLELGHIVAGPSAGLILADLGADVIKVERSGESDQSRTMPAGTSALFHFLNRNKRSIAIDLKGSAEGRALFLRLAAASDVVIDNFAYGAVEALGLGYDVLSRPNPRIIYLALKGFLPGPNEARPFLDELAQMSAGLAFMTGPRGQPIRAGASIVDVGAAAYGVIAVLAALQQRARTVRAAAPARSARGRSSPQCVGAIHRYSRARTRHRQATEAAGAQHRVRDGPAASGAAAGRAYPRGARGAWTLKGRDRRAGVAEGHRMSGAGNITTEDLVFRCQEMGIDLDAMIEAGQPAKRVVGHPLPDKLKSGGNLEKQRARARAAATTGAV